MKKIIEFQFYTLFFLHIYSCNNISKEKSFKEIVNQSQWLNITFTYNDSSFFLPAESKVYEFRNDIVIEILNGLKTYGNYQTQNDSLFISMKKDTTVSNFKLIEKKYPEILTLKSIKPEIPIINYFINIKSVIKDGKSIKTKLNNQLDINFKDFIGKWQLIELEKSFNINTSKQIFDDPSMYIEINDEYCTAPFLFGNQDKHSFIFADGLFAIDQSDNAIPKFLLTSLILYSYGKEKMTMITTDYNIKLKKI